MRKGLLILTAFLLICSACSKEKSHIGIYTVGSELVYRHGANGLQPCLVIKEKGDMTWTVIYEWIRGFEYERGYEYEIVMRISKITPPPIDMSDQLRVLIEVISKTKKDSENLPDIY